MNCDDFRLMLDNYANLTDDEKAALSEHAEQCPKCRSELDFLMSVINYLNTLPKIEPPADFLEKVNSRIDAEENKGRIWRAVKKYSRDYSSIAACLLLAAVIGNNGETLSERVTYNNDGAAVSSFEISEGKNAPEIDFAAMLLPTAAPQTGFSEIQPRTSQPTAAPSNGVKKTFGSASGTSDNTAENSGNTARISGGTGRTSAGAPKSSGTSGSAGSYSRPSYTYPSVSGGTDTGKSNITLNDSIPSNDNIQTSQGMPETANEPVYGPSNDQGGGTAVKPTAPAAVPSNVLKPSATRAPVQQESSPLRQNVSNGETDDSDDGIAQVKIDPMDEKENISESQGGVSHSHGSATAGGSTSSGGIAPSKPTVKPNPTVKPDNDDVEDHPEPTKRPDTSSGISGSHSGSDEDVTHPEPPGSSGGGGPSGSGGAASGSGGGGSSGGSSGGAAPPTEGDSSDEIGEAIIEISYTDEEQLSEIKEILNGYALYTERDAYMIDGDSINDLESEILSVADSCSVNVYSTGNIISVTLVY